MPPKKVNRKKDTSSITNEDPPASSDQLVPVQIRIVGTKRKKDCSVETTKPKKTKKVNNEDGTTLASIKAKPLFTGAAIEPNVRKFSSSNTLPVLPVLPTLPRRNFKKQQTHQSHQHQSYLDSIDPVNLQIKDAVIDKLQFTFISTEEIEKWSVLEITNSKLGGNNSLFDLRLGPSNMNEKCATCESQWKICPGHFGRITLPRRVPHPLRMKNIVQYLNLFCFKCFRLVISKDRMLLFSMNKKSGDSKMKDLLEHRLKNIDTCPYCDEKLPDFAFDDEFKFFGHYSKTQTFLITIKEIEEIFDNIPPCDIADLGLDEDSVHPSNLLLGAILVIPPCARSYVKNASGINHDDLTYKYQEIIKCVQKYHEAGENSKLKSDIYNSICFHVRTLMDNTKGKAKNNGNKRGLKCLKNRLTSKTGLIRGHLQGKRVNYCGRSVITPDGTVWVDEVIVPEVFAKHLSYPVKVNAINLKECQALLDADKVNYIERDDVRYNAAKVMWTRGFELGDNDIIIRRDTFTGASVKISVFEHFHRHHKLPQLQHGDSVLRHHKLYENVVPKERKHFQLQPGDIIERQLKDGDWTLFNRQPTLWKGSMRAMKVRIRPGKTFRFNLACTQAYNADFDGDEMNMFLCQSEATRSECSNIVSVGKNFTSSQDSKPMLAIKQDAMTGAYKLTFGYVPIRKEIMMDCLTHEKFPFEDYVHKYNHNKKTQ